ncbi:MAG: hypothetical protein RI894_965 [Bacteroidota bacterium]
MYSLEGNFKEALRHYREAIRMSHRDADSEIFFQHYSQCVMEALELSGAHDEVIAYCDTFLDFLAEKLDENSADTSLLTKYYAAVLERQAIQFLLQGEKEDAIDTLKLAQQKVGRGKQPITDDLLNWALRGYTISKKQVTDLQRKHQYFIVRKDTVQPAIAVELPQGFSPF